MTNPLAICNCITGQAESQYAQWEVPPIVVELEAIFKKLPDEELMAKLKGPRRRGPNGYNASILWRCYVTYYVLGLPSVSDLIRLLYDNPYIAAACGINSPADMPSQPTFSRFFQRLSIWQFKAQVNKIFYRLTQKCYHTLPDFGKSVAMDATDLKA